MTGHPYTEFKSRNEGSNCVSMTWLATGLAGIAGRVIGCRATQVNDAVGDMASFITGPRLVASSVLSTCPSSVNSRSCASVNPPSN